MIDTVFVRKIGTNSLGFDIDTYIMQQFNYQIGSIIRIKFLQIVKKNSMKNIHLENIFMIKKIIKGPSIIIKSPLVKMFDIEEKDALTIQYCELESSST